MIGKIVKFLSSLRFTIVLICLLGVIFALGLMIPQKSLVKEIYFDWQQNSPALVAFLDALQLTEIYTSWLTLAVWFLFFINLAIVIWQRMPLVKKRIEMPASRIVAPESATGYLYRGSFPLPEGVDGGELLARLGKRGYTVLGDAKGFFAVRNRYSPLAFAFFHLSFFLILLGGAIGIYTTFIGYVDLAQDEPFDGRLENYNGSPRPTLPKIGGVPKASFTITSVTPKVVKNTPTGISVQLQDQQGKLHEVGINTPYKTDYTFFVFKHLGVTPLFVLKDPAGKDIEGAYFKLDVLQGKQDEFAIGGLKFYAHFFPDHTLDKEGKHATRSQEFNNPAFYLVAERDGKVLAEGALKSGGALQLPGYTLELREHPFWVRFYVIKERGTSILYTGFAIACVAVIWRLLWYRREIVGALRQEEGGGTLVVAAKSEFYKSLAEDEFNKLFQGILGQKQEE